MMRVLIVFSHPYEGSYGNAILRSVSKGLQKANHETDLIHLDNDGFDPVMSREDLQAFVARKPVDPKVIDYQNRLKRADHLIIIFPVWWDAMPAIIKGFVDRVLSPGVVYDHHPIGFGLVPLLTSLKGVTIITTMNKPHILYALLTGNLIRKAMLRSVFKTMGYKNLRWINFASVKSVSQKKRESWLAGLEARFSTFN